MVGFCRVRYLDRVMCWGFLGLFIRPFLEVLRARGRVVIFVSTVVVSLSLFLFIEQKKLVSVSFLNPLGNRDISIAGPRTDVVRAISRYS